MEHLEIILRELKEAVVVCDSNARILLFNAAAKRLFQDSEAIALGRSLYDVCAQAPIKHTLQILQHRSTGKDHFDLSETDTSLVCATVDGSLLLDCNISKISSKHIQGTIFLFTFEDITRQVSKAGKQGYLLEKMIKDLRAPITNLNAAAENLKRNPKMVPEIRVEFEDVIFKESAELTQRFENIVHESRKITNLQWPLSDVYSADLIGCIAQKFKEEEYIAVTMIGVPLWLHADSYSLMLVLESLVQFVHGTCNVTEIDMEALLGDRRVYIDIVWKGDPIPQTVIDSMLEVSLPESDAGITVSDVLKRHDSEIWSQKHRREGYSLLRIPLPDSPRLWEETPKPVLERNEFYDFSIIDKMKDPGELADRPLSSLNYVVFDTEATGLRPTAGDEILEIAAVRIVNSRILSGEKFERHIKPQRPIPESSIFFLNITEEMLQEEAPIQEVLPQFSSYVSDAVLVAHNGRFDMHFFQRMEDESGVIFENPMLDTLLLSLVIEEDRTDYTLESISRELGVEIVGSHTTMDDCFLTAQVFLRFLALLEAKGIKTLGEAISASEKVAKKKRKQMG
jgi:DNA polymerase-3 subunit epsilon